MKIQIPAGTPFISIDENGGIQTHAITPHVHFKVCPTWLEIAARHAQDANKRKLARVAAWNSTNEDAKAETLVNLAKQIVQELIKNGKPSNAEVETYAKSL